MFGGNTAAAEASAAGALADGGYSGLALLASFVAWDLRQAIRDKYKIKRLECCCDPMCEDACCVICCYSCALAQEKATLTKESKESGTMEQFKGLLSNSMQGE